MHKVIRSLTLASTISCVTSISIADINAHTLDGREVILKEDGTWAFSHDRFSDRKDYQPIDIDDLKVDIKKMVGTKIEVSGLGIKIGSFFVIKKESWDSSPVQVNIESLPREQVKKLIQSGPEGTRMTLYGVIGKVYYGLGVIAESIEFK